MACVLPTHVICSVRHRYAIWSLCSAFLILATPGCPGSDINRVLVRGLNAVRVSENALHALSPFVSYFIFVGILFDR